MIYFEQLTAPGFDVLGLDIIKNHLRIDHNLDDARLRLFESSAVLRCEQMLHRRLRAQQIRINFEQVATHYTLPDVTPVSDVEKVELRSGDNWFEIQKGIDWDITPGEMPRLLIRWDSLNQVYSNSFSEIQGRPFVRVTLTCGYASAELVPAPIKSWLLLKIAELYENSEASADVEVKSHSFVDGLVAPYRVGQF